MPSHHHGYSPTLKRDASLCFEDNITTAHDSTCVEPPVRVESVESVEGGHAGLAHEGLLLGVDPDVDLATVCGGHYL